MSSKDTDRKYSCVLFDVDHTLINTDSFIKSALRQCGGEDVEQIPEDTLRTSSPPQLLRRQNCTETADEFWRYYQREIRENAGVIDEDTPAVLKELEERGVRLGIVSSARKAEVVLMLKQCGLLHYLERCLVTYGSCRPHKPHPKPIYYALEILNQPPGQTLYVGDSKRDAEASCRAGVDFAIPGWADLEPGLIQRLQELSAGVYLKKVSLLLNFTNE